MWLVILGVLAPIFLYADAFQFNNGRCQNSLGTAGLNAVLLTQCSDLRDKILIGQKFKLVDLRHSNFWKANLSESSVENSDFTRIQWRDGTFRKGECLNSKFIDADLRGLLAEEGLWRSCHLDGADLRGAKLWRARFVGTSLVRVDLRYAFLSHTSFEGSDLRGADLSQAVIVQADFKRAKFDSQTRLPFSEAEALKRGMIKLEQ